MYTDDYNKLSKQEILQFLINKKAESYTNNISGRAVYCITTNKVFDSITNAEKAYNAKQSGIRKCCEGNRKTSGTLPDGTKLSWMFLKDYIEINNMTMEEFVAQYHYSSFLLE